MTTALSAAVFSLVALPARAQLATPAGGAVVAGSASIAQAPGATTITQSTARAAINWQSFNVGSQATVLFQQPSSQAVTLNRVMAPDPSTIAGRITANGSIVLVNPDGVVFANGSEVNAAGLVVSAPGITNQNFMAGRMVFNRPANPNARIVNRGSITIAQAGLAALVAPQVANSGVIAAKLGSVVLAGARTATLDLYGDGLVSIDVEGAVQTVPVGPNGKPVKALVTNSGTIAAEGGTVLLSAKAVDGLIQNLVDAGGTISANGASGAAGGTVLVQGVGGSIRIAGTLTANGEGPGGTGGAIGLDATGRVTVANGARVDASGPAGGGLVAVGTTLARAKGGPGTTATLTAAHVLIAPGATISADATEAGNGGRVTVLSTVTTADHGAITAEGGSLGGNGGFVEISGHNLTLDGTVNTGAPLGAMGTILLDPYNLQIVASGTSDGDVGPTGVPYTAGDITSGSTDTVSASVIESLTGNVTLQAINNVEFSANLALTGTNQSLLVQAGNDILIDSGVTVSATGNIEMDASSAAISGSTMTGGITMNGVIVAGGNISLSAGTGGVFFGDFVDANDGNVTTNQTTGTLAVNTTGNFEQVAGTISAVTLSGSASFVDVESAGNAVGTLGAFTVPTASAITLSDGIDLTIAGPVSAANGIVVLTSTGNLTIAGQLNVAGGLLSLFSGGSIIEPGGSIVALTMSGTSGGAVLLNGTNNAVGTLGDLGDMGTAFAAGGEFAFSDSTALTLTAPVTVPEGSTITLATDSLVEGSQFDEETGGTEFGALEAPGGEVSIEPFTASVPVALVGAGPQPAGTLSLDDALLAAITAGTLQLTSFGSEPITISGANQLGGLTDPNTGNPSGVNTLLVAAGGAFSEAAGASLNVGVLSGSAASVGLGGANVVGTLDQFASDSGFELTDTTGLTVLGTVSDPTGITLDVTSSSGITLGNFVAGEGSLSSNPATGTVSLLTSGDIVQDSGAITAGTLTGSASFAFLDDANAISTLGSFTVATDGELFLNDGVNLNVAGPVSAIGGFVSLASTGNLSFSGELNATGGTVVLSAGGGITEPGGAILASVLNGTSGGAALFTGTNTIGTLADVSNSQQSGPFDAFVAGGDFTLVDSTPLTLEAPVSVPAGDTIALVTNGLIEGSQTIFTSTGSVTVFGALEAPGGEVSIEPFSADVPVALVGAGTQPAGTLSIDDALLAVITAGTLALTSLGSEPITISGANQLGNLTDPNTGQTSGVGTLLATAGGALSESAGASLDVGVLTGSAGSVALGGINTIATLADVTLPAPAGGFTLADTENLVLAGALNAGTVALTINGSLNETSPGAITAGTLTADITSADLGGANAVGTLQNITSNGGFTLDNPASFIIAGSLDASNGMMLLNSNGAVVENAGSITANLLSGSLASGTLGGENDINELGNLTALGGFALTDQESLSIGGVVNMGTSSAAFTIKGGSLLETGTGTLSVGTLSGSAIAVSLPNGQNAISTLDAFGATGGFTLTDSEGLVLSGLLNVGTADSVVLTIRGGLSESSTGGIAAGTLAGTAATATLTRSNAIGAIGPVGTLEGFSATSGGFTLADDEALGIAGVLSAIGNDVSLSINGGLRESGSGEITADTLTGSAMNATLTGANTITDLASFTAIGGFALADRGNLALTGPVSSAGSEAEFILTNGGLSQTTNGVLTAGTLVASASSIDLPDSANAISSLGTISAPGGLTLVTTTGLTVFSEVNTGSAPVFLSALGDVAETPGGALISGLLTGSANAASFANSNTVSALGSFTALGGFTLDNAGALPIVGPVDAGSSTALLVAAGQLYETTLTVGSKTITGSIIAGQLTGSAGSVTLDASSNRIATLGSFSSGAFEVTDGESLSILGTIIGDPIDLVVTGTLALGSSVSSGSLVSAGPVSLTVSGTITEPAGVIDSASLGGNAASADLGGANQVLLLDAFTTTGSFVFNAVEPTLILNGPLSAATASLASSGSLVLDGLIASGSATLTATGPITEPFGVIETGTFAGSAADAALIAANSIDTLSVFSTPGTLLLNDASSLAVVGPVSASLLSITDPAAVSFSGSTSVGTLSVIAGGSITEPSGTVTVGLLEGSATGLAQFGPDAPAGNASIASLGSFTVTDGSFTLTNSEPLTFIGPLTANYFAISAPGSIVLNHATITTVGLPLAEQSGTQPARPGSYFSVTTPGGEFLAFGRTLINPGGSADTLRINLPPGGDGVISLGDLIAPTTTLILDTGLGTAIGTIDLAALDVVGDLGSADLTGMVSNISGLIAASKSTISPFESSRYRLNSCPLMSVNCIFLAPLGVPQGNPLTGLSIAIEPNQREIELILPNVASQDY